MVKHNTERIAKNTVFLYIRMIIVMCVSLFTSRIILKILGFEDFGIYNVVGSVVVFFSFLQAALRNATSRYLTYDIGLGYPDNISRTFSMAVNSHIILALIIWVLLELGGVWFINNKLVIEPERVSAANWAYQFSLLTFCVSVIKTPFESSIIAHEKMDFYAITSIIEVLLKLAIVYLLIVSPVDKLIAYSFLVFCVALVLLLWFILYCRRQFADTRYIKYWDSETLIKFVQYSGWSILVNGACVVRSQSINIFFNLFMGVVANAAMGIANQVISALNMFVQNFTQAFRPQIIKSYAAQDYDYFNRLVFLTSKISYLLLLFISIPIISNIDFILRIWLGEYPEMTPVFIQAIVLYYLVDALQEPLLVAVHATGNIKYHQIYISSIIFLVVPISYIMLKSGCSGESVLILNALSNVVCAIVRTMYMKKLIGLNIYLYVSKVILPLSVITLLSVPLPIILSNVLVASWKTFIIISLISVVITAGTSIIFGLDKSERQYVMKFTIVKKILRKV